MSLPGNLRPLTNSEKNLCEYAGIFGVLLTATCLIQHFIFAIPGPVTNPMIPAYFFSIVAFILLGLQKYISIYLLIISAVFSILIEWLWMTHYSFSLAVLLLFVYHVSIVIILLANDIPRKLKLKKALEKSEKQMWEGKI